MIAYYNKCEAGLNNSCYRYELAYSCFNKIYLVWKFCDYKFSFSEILTNLLLKNY
jgi:hypothetical protein